MTPDVVLPPVRPVGPDDWALLKHVRLTALADAPEAFYSTLVKEEHRTEAEWRTWAGQLRDRR
jgi:hypothetical protein